MIDTRKIKKIVLPNLPYVLLFWLFDKIGEAYRIAPGRDMLHKLTATVNALNTAFARPAPSFDMFDLTIGLIGAAAIYGVVQYRRHNSKKWRKEVLCYKGRQWRRPENIAVRTLAAQANGQSHHGFEPRKESSMKLEYVQVGDYLLPALKLNDPPNAPPIGRYGKMRRAFLKEHRPIEYSRLLLSEQLFSHLREVDKAAATRLTVIDDREIAHEVILAELVYA
ncbi:hypothetical protein FACS1894202_11310 [Clostridia bacterium]|nr:hypothetical protein FACS1894202_11310 [Clostridia bacterium]